MSDLELKDFRKKYNLSQEALARILNVATVTVRKWEQGIYKIPAPVIKLIELYDLEGLPAPVNNNTSAGVSNKDLQINELIKQINDLTSKFLEAINILKYKEPVKDKDKQIKDIVKELSEALSIKSHLQKHNRLKTLIEELKKVVD